MLWLESGRAAAATLGGEAALSVDVGAAHVEVLGVVHHAPLVHAAQWSALPRAVRPDLLALLREDLGPDLDLTDRQLEDVFVRACFVGDRENCLKWKSLGEENAPKPKEAKTIRAGPGGALTIKGRAREMAADSLFRRDLDCGSLPDLILQSLAASPRDTRAPLAENILVWGGVAETPGFRARLAEELKYLATQPPYSDRLHIKEFKFHPCPCRANIVSWVGGSVLGSADGGVRTTSRDVWVRTRRLHDWADARDNTPPQHYLWRQLTL